MQSADLVDWRAKAATASIDSRLVIAGRRRSAPRDSIFSLNPATGETIAAIPVATDADVDEAVAAARTAQPAWASLSHDARTAILVRVADAVEDARDELALLDSLEMGMPIGDALADIPGVAENLRGAARLAGELHASVEGSGARYVEEIREPHGVVAAIAPWNFPLYTAVAKIAPALAVGNAVILKPSEIASLSALRLADIAAQAGLPDGVLSVVTGPGTGPGAALARRRDIDCLTFTGSTKTAGAIMAAVGEAAALKPLLLECGGKSPQIICPDAAEDTSIAPAVARAVFWNAGQVCVAGSRLLLPRRAAARFAEALEAAAADWTFGEPLDPRTRMGPLASLERRRAVEALMAAGLRQGGRIICGGRSPNSAGAFFPATIVDGLYADNVLCREEVFGPVLSIIPYDDLDQAIDIANSVDYGLTASIITRDAALGRLLAGRITAGGVSITDHAGSPRIAAARFGMEPRKQSGFGAEGGLPGLLAMTRPKMISLDIG
jgi:acyl-CoA reductase-like NAD-dependent aldehyde dehydrogenase